MGTRPRKAVGLGSIPRHSTQQLTVERLKRDYMATQGGVAAERRWRQPVWPPPCQGGEAGSTPVVCAKSLTTRPFKGPRPV